MHFMLWTTHHQSNRQMKRIHAILFISITMLILCPASRNWCQTAHNTPEKITLKIAGLQMNVTGSIHKNKITIINSIEKAAKSGAKFLVTPEGSLSGYHTEFIQEELADALQQVTAEAKKHQIGILLGTCYKEINKTKEVCYNQVRFYTPKGDYLGAQSKYLLCSPVDFPASGEMLDYIQGYPQVFEWNGIKFGILICNDLWATPGYTTISNPYLPLKLKQLGAEIIIHAINSGTNQRYKKFHEASVELWAYSLQIPIMEVNAAKGSKKINAVSGYVNILGERTVIVPDKGEQLFYCSVTIER